MLKGREFILEGDRIPTERRQGVLLTDDDRPIIAKGHFDDEESPIVTWTNLEGDIKGVSYNSIAHMGQQEEFKDATHCKALPYVDKETGVEYGDTLFPLSLGFR